LGPFIAEAGQHIFDLSIAKVYYVCADWAIPQKQSWSWHKSV